MEIALLTLTCCCCDGPAPAQKQWYSRDNGYGLCGRCAQMIQGRKDYDAIEFKRCYGVAGIHWMPQEETISCYGNIDR